MQKSEFHYFTLLQKAFYIVPLENISWALSLCAAGGSGGGFACAEYGAAG